MIDLASSTRRFWENRASALARRINVAAWLARLAPAAFFVATAASVALYALRRAEIPLLPAWCALLGALSVAALACWWRARGGFYRPADARVLLESRLQLDSRLTAADLGLVAWPPVPRELPAILRWKLRAPASWLAAASILIVLAVVLPVLRDPSATRPTGSPPALVQADAMLAAIKEMNVAEPQALEQLAERARELARRPSEEQYSHSALEAADALRNQTALGAEQLARGLDDAAKALRAADNEADMQAAAGQLAAALAGLRDGAMPANKDLLKNLPSSGADLKNLTPEQRAQLAQQLANAANGLNGVTGAAGANADVAQPDPNAPGSGPAGVRPGGETAPLMLSGQPSDAGDGSSQALSEGALKRFALGDKLGATTSEHEVDREKLTESMAGGAVAAPAAGGEAVWVNRLTPAERAALKNFFK